MSGGEEKMNDRTENLSCSFCGKNKKDVRYLVAGPTAYICEECARLVLDIIDEEDAMKSIKRNDAIRDCRP